MSPADVVSCVSLFANLTSPSKLDFIYPFLAIN